MTDLKRSPLLVVALLLLLAACGGTASSATPAASSVTPAPTAAALVTGEFISKADQPEGIALSTNGRQVIAYLCNGTLKHVSLEEWFSGPVTGAGIDITNARGAHLVAAVSAQAITGTVTLNDGTSTPFTARLIPHPGSDNYGLFRSEETFNGVPYLGGWIFPPPAPARAPAGTETSLTSAVYPLMIGPGPERWGGILDKRTGALIVSPPLDKANPFRVTVPNVGTFVLTQCLQAQC